MWGWTLAVAPRAVRLALALGLVWPGAAVATAAGDSARYRAWIEEMKTAPRGPFEAIRWYCRDGAVLPPKAGACAGRGGGVQHGAWSERTRQLRAAGYSVANVLADIDPKPFAGADAKLEPFAQLLIERFLVRADDGWILRQARSYRGALQAEDEEAGADRLLLALAGEAGWNTPVRFVLLREAVRLLPQQEGTSTEDIRQRASALAERDPAFATVRNKIHALPEPSDAAAVRAYVAARGNGARPYLELADAIDALYAARGPSAALARLAPRLGDERLAARLRDVASLAGADAPPDVQLAAAARASAELRDGLAALSSARRGLVAFEASLALEELAFAASARVLADPDPGTRRARLTRLETLATSLYGAGLLSARQLDAARAELERLTGAARLDVGTYRRGLRALARVPEWSQRMLEFHFEPATDRLAQIEPLARLYVQDRLRGSPLLAYGRSIDELLVDADALAGVRHKLFGRRVGAGLRPLNPGLARATLHVVNGPLEGAGIRSDGIYLLPQTVADLPPVAGLLTRGEGSSLSHVQLLARNLGIPNVLVRDELVPAVEAHAGRAVVLAVSPRGVVELVEEEPRFAAIFGREAPGSELLIRPDLAKLDLEARRLLRLDELRATDSGRVVGPKAANLGELRHHFGDAVPDAVAIPFGVFRELLEQPLEPGGPSVFEWMRAQYARLRKLPEGEERTRETRAFLERLRGWIERADPGAAFFERLRAKLTEVFGPDERVGVFVRSDTNVEDLPGFTGAGLNLTLPHVVGFENVRQALGRVWASPFTERAYMWRQAHMEQPEYVFPGVLLQRSFPSEKSGVLVTVDVDSGDPSWLSVATNEGVGGAVEGQAAEELRIHRRSGELRLLAQASAPTKAVLAPRGGIERVPASGAEVLLTPEEIAALRELVDRLPRLPGLHDAKGALLPADVEFAFGGGRLVLLQIRPFVESRRARRSGYLRELGRAAERAASKPVDLDAPPRVDAS